MTVQARFLEAVAYDEEGWVLGGYIVGLGSQEDWDPRELRGLLELVQQTAVSWLTAEASLRGYRVDPDRVVWYVRGLHENPPLPVQPVTMPLRT